MPIVAFTASLSTFFILFSSEGRKCDFFVRHNEVLVDAFDEMFAPMGEIVQQMGRSGTRLVRRVFSTGGCNSSPFETFSPIGANLSTNACTINVCIPNEDCGKRNSGSGVSFRGILRGVVVQIEYSHPRKVPRKDTPDPLFRFPQYSFGMHKSPSKRHARPAVSFSTIFAWEACSCRKVRPNGGDCLQNGEEWHTTIPRCMLYARHVVRTSQPPPVSG